MAGRANLVQAELFNMGMDVSMKEFEAELIERMDSGSPLKTVFRIFDESGKITSQIRCLQRLQNEDREIHRAFGSAGRFGRWWLQKRSRWNFRITRAAEAKALKEIVDELCRAVKESREIGVERNDHSFRHAHKDELHELVESARRAKNFWAFVFTPNDLLSDKNEFVTSYN